MKRRSFLLGASGLLLPQEPLIRRAWWFLGHGPRMTEQVVTLADPGLILVFEQWDIAGRPTAMLTWPIQSSVLLDMLPRDRSFLTYKSPFQNPPERANQ